MTFMRLQNPQQTITIAAMKALLALIAIAAVSVGGTGFYYVNSTSEFECSASKGECLPLTEECGLNAPCDEAAKPDRAAKPACTDQKKTEGQNPT